VARTVMRSRQNPPAMRERLLVGISAGVVMLIGFTALDVTDGNLLVVFLVMVPVVAAQYLLIRVVSGRWARGTPPSQVDRSP
jgi:hypothetical protein